MVTPGLHWSNHLHLYDQHAKDYTLDIFGHAKSLRSLQDTRCPRLWHATRVHCSCPERVQSSPSSRRPAPRGFPTARVLHAPSSPSPWPSVPTWDSPWTGRRVDMALGASSLIPCPLPWLFKP